MTTSQEWAVTAEARAPEFIEIDPRVFDDFLDALYEYQAAGGGYGGGWAWTITIEAATPAEAAARAMKILDEAAAQSGVPVWPYVELQVLDYDELDRRLALPADR